MTPTSPAMIHATYGMTELLFRGLVGAGCAPEQITFISTQPQETEIVRRLSPDSLLVLPASKPDPGLTAWNGVKPSKLLDALLEESPLIVLDLLLADRHLRRWPTDTAVQWLNTTADLYFDLIAARQPAVILGEVANASEHLLQLVAEHLGTPYVWPGTLRVPSRRFGLWLGPRSEELWRRAPERTREIRDESRAQLEEFLSGSEDPYYLDLYSAAPALTARSVVKPVQQFLRRSLVDRRFAMQMPRLGDYFTLPWLNRVRKVRYSRKVAHITWNSLPDTPYVYFPLHVQPEASIDWFPANWRNQLESAAVMGNVLARRDVTLVVKDHANMLWSRGAVFHRQLLALHNVLVVSPNLDSGALAAGARCTVTVSGTVALEAGLRGLPVAVVSEQPWTELPTVDHIACPEDIDIVLDRICRVTPDEEAVAEWFADYYANGWPGVVSEPYSFPDVLSAENVGNLSRALREFLSAPENRFPDG